MMFVLHQATREYIFPVQRDRLHIRLQICGEPVKVCKIIYWNRFFADNISEKHIPCAGGNNSYRYYETDLTLHGTAQYIRYFFVLETNTETIFWSRNGRETSKPQYFFEYLSTAELDIMCVPDWAAGSVWYQIFPDRYYRSDFSNDNADCQPWKIPPTRENHLGGNLAGIREKLPYLQSLGIDALYLNPVFSAPSNHKYDTVDYFSIDPSFGTTQDLVDLVQQCHQGGIKVVLDGVFNHCGYYSAQFQDVLKNGAESEYADWFYIHEFPVQSDPPNYECVGYYKWMPNLRFKTRAVRDFFLRVGRYWIETADIDGWRLDVADEVDFTFWQEFRREIKSVKPGALLLAETWRDGRDMLRGDQMDTVMNYLFRDAVVDFFARQAIDAEAFIYLIEQMLFGYHKVTRSILFNVIGSHDTTRFMTLCGGNLNKFKLALVFQMTFPGMPVIYYGDEIGMNGENDPDCRKFMDWEHINEDLLEFYKRLISLRKERTSLRFGDFKTIYNNAHTVAFVRRNDTETTYIILNNSADRHTAYIPLLDEAVWQQSAFSDFRIVPEVVNNGSDGENQKKIDSEYVFKMVLDEYHFEIITTRRK